MQLSSVDPWVSDGQVSGELDTPLEKRIQTPRKETTCPEFGLPGGILPGCHAGGEDMFREAVYCLLYGIRYLMI